MAYSNHEQANLLHSFSIIFTAIFEHDKDSASFNLFIIILNLLVTSFFII
jgi:hypothetical protein